MRNPYEEADRVIAEVRDRWYASEIRCWFPYVDDPQYIVRHGLRLQERHPFPGKPGYTRRPYWTPQERAWVRAVLLADETKTRACIELIQEFHTRFRHIELDERTPPAMQFLHVRVPQFTAQSPEKDWRVQIPVDARIWNQYGATLGLHTRGHRTYELRLTDAEDHLGVMNDWWVSGSPSPYEPLQTLLSENFGAFEVLTVTPYYVESWELLGVAPELVIRLRTGTCPVLRAIHDAHRAHTGGSAPDHDDV